MLSLEIAHEHSSSHRTEIEKSSLCGCFYCLRVYPVEEIQQWIGDGCEATAICPYCCVDAIIADASGYPLDEEFLQEMSELWFEVSSPLGTAIVEF